MTYLALAAVATVAAIASAVVWGAHRPRPSPPPGVYGFTPKVRGRVAVVVVEESVAAAAYPTPVRAVVPLLPAYLLASAPYHHPAILDSHPIAAILLHPHTPQDFLSFKANILSGITLSAWLRILVGATGSIHWLRYTPRVLFLTALATWNSLLAFVETVLHGRSIASATTNTRPVFILGHPRTGTTHLFNLMALDAQRFNTCTTFHCGFPSCFLWFKRFKGLLAGMVPKTRPMDNMALGLDTPQEDEVRRRVLP